MVQSNFKRDFILSIIIAILMVIASAGGLLAGWLYRDNVWTTSQLRGNDLVTLFVAVPLLLAAVFLSKRGSLRAQLVWFGILDYTLYNYAFYLFGAAFNRFFLIYTALFVLSIFALIFGLSGLNVNELSKKFRKRTPVKLISGYMMFWAFSIGGLWIAQSVAFIVTGKVPQVIMDSGHPTSIVFALDLSLLVPFLILGAVWLWKRRPWGLILSVILNVKGAVYALALTAMAISAAKADIPGASSLVPLWLFFTAASFTACLLLLVNIKEQAE